MDSLKLSFMEKNDIQESARVLSVAMLNNPLHVAVFQGRLSEHAAIQGEFGVIKNELP